MVFAYKDYDGLGLAELIRNKEVKPEEVKEMAIREIEEKNPKLNAVIHKMYDESPIDSSGMFFGVPILTKNISQESKGHPMTAGSKALVDVIADEDSEFVRQIKNTGVIIIGQTNVPELALMGITEPELYGPTRNPWNTDYTPGGSSGGAAAAVASGMVPVAGANDGGGSIRIPSAYCGLFGLKPTRGRTPVGPKVGRNWQGASVDHILSRTVRDSAAMLDQYRLDRYNAFVAPPFHGSYLEAAGTPVAKRLKVAYTVNSPIGLTVDRECREAVEKTVKLLETMGHHVEEKAAPVDGKKIANSYIYLYFAEVASALREMERILGRNVAFNDVEPATWMLGLLGRTVNAEELLITLKYWDEAAIAMEKFHDEYDIYITPTTAHPPAKIGELDLTPMEKRIIPLVGSLRLTKLLRKTGFVDKLVNQSLERTPFTQLANLTGQPAMTLPMHLIKEGLPVGVQVMARRGREDLLFQLAGELEQSDLWIDVKKNPNY